MKKLIILLLTAGLLTACKNADDAVNIIKGVAGIAKGTQAAKGEQVPAPKIESFGYKLPEFPESLVNSTAQTFKTDIQYTPGKKQIIYFDEHGKVQNTLQPQGYFRELLGKTADGRWVAQDFYQDSKVLQTAPFIVPKTGDIRSFDAEGNMDGLHIHFDRAGNLDSIVNMENGKQASPMYLYEKGKLLAQFPIGEGSRFAAYYEDGKTIAVIFDFPQGMEKEGKMTYFRPDGSAIGEISQKDGKPQNIISWNATGEVSKSKDLVAEFEAAENRMKYVLSRLVAYGENDGTASAPAASAAK